MKFKVIVLACFYLFAGDAVKAQEHSQLDHGLYLDGQAHQLYAQGQYQQAYEVWAEAQKIFIAEEYETGISATIVQMALSQDYLGYPVQACQTLLQLMAFDSKVCQPAVSQEFQIPDLPTSYNYVIASIALGNILRDWGRFTGAEKYLDHAIDEAENIGDDEAIVGAKIARANLILAQLKLKRDRFQLLSEESLDLNEIQQINALFNKAFSLYDEILESRDELDSQIKWLKLYHELALWDSLLVDEKELNNRKASYRNYLASLASSKFDTSPFHFARQKLEVAKVMHTACQHRFTCKQDNQYFVLAMQSVIDAINAARSINNSFLQSHGYGYLGVLYKTISNEDLAFQAFRKASKYAIRSDKPDPLYRWQYEIGNLLRESGNLEEADRYYEASINSIEKAELNINSLNREIRTDFQESVRPLFETYMSHLLDRETPDFESVLAVRDQLKLSEIQNYLSCGFLDSIPTSEIAGDIPNTTVINILKLKDAYHIIAKTPKGYHHHAVNRQLVEEELNRLISILEDESIIFTSTAIFDDSLISLHQTLIQPILPLLERNSTLLFSSDSVLQRIPMAMLKSESGSYLVEQFRIASVGESQYEPVPLNQRDLKVFFAGVSDYNPIFPDYESLSGVEKESEAISAIGDSKNLLNQKFTANSFLLNLTKNKVVHVATHGQFSSNPAKTFLAAWDKPITVEELSDVVRKRIERGLGPIELLVLSACETAKGDRKASLGLAGFAIQAGARSTIASLWNSDDHATSIMMSKFYQSLKDGKSKVDALREAQLSLLRDPNYENPYFWANFILIGSWL